MATKQFDVATVDPRIKSGKAAWTHIESEFLDVVDDIIDTLVPEGPYAYTLPWAHPEDGSIPYQHFATDLPTLRAAYEDMHRYSVVQAMTAIAEVRSDWYTFCYGMGEGTTKPAGETLKSPTAVMFPTMGHSGITGELIWRRSATGAPFTGGREGPLAAELACFDRHEAWLACVRQGDAEGAAALHHPDAQIGVRDYVNHTGTLSANHSAADYREHLTQFFARYDVVDIQMVERVVQDWFAFAELVWIVRDKQAGSRLCKFNTIDIAEVRPDGLFASRIGHGTDIEPI